MNKRIKDIDLNNGLFTLIYGQIDDVFIGQDTLSYSMNQLLYLHLKKERYDVVAFYDTSNSFFSYAHEDLVKLFKVAKLASTPPKTGNSSWNTKKNNVETAQKGIVFPSKPGPLGKEIFTGTSSGESLKTLKSALEDRSQKVALVFQTSSRQGFLSSDEFLDCIATLHRDYNIIDNKPKIVITFSTNDRGLTIANNLPNILQQFVTQITDNGLKDLRAEVCHEIGKPDTEEIKCLLQQKRLVYGHDVNFLDVNDIAMGLHGKSIARIEKDLEGVGELSIKRLVELKIIKEQRVKIDEESFKLALAKVKGQGHLTAIIINQLKSFLCLRNQKTPLVLFSVGPSGVGKTYTAEIIQAELEKMGYGYVKFNMGGYTQEHEVSKMVGSPPGYEGSREEPLLFVERRTKGKLLVVLDELEKAHSNMIQRLLSLFDKGELDWKGKNYEFRDCIFILTSNAERDKVVKIKNDALKGVKVEKQELDILSSIKFQDAIGEVIAQYDGGRKFSLEFCGRIGQFLVYSPLGYQSIQEAVVEMIHSTGKEQLDINISIVDKALLEQLAKEAQNSKFGFRPVNKLIGNKLMSLAEGTNDLNSSTPYKLTETWELSVLTEKEPQLEHSVFDTGNAVEDILEIKSTNIKELEEYKKLHEMIGLGKVKIEISELIEIFEFDRQSGIESNGQGMHMVFQGPPGTGKTETARLMAKMLHSLELLSKGHMIEADRSKMVAGYVGQTAIQTNKLIDAAIGGVLFIDEAYGLSSSNGGNDFGKEAIETLLKRMEDERDDLVVIVAGYEREMRNFIGSNPGLYSRFTRFINFEHYSLQELIEIFNFFVTKSKILSIDNDFDETLANHIRRIKDAKGMNFGNARDIRTFADFTINYAKLRLNETRRHRELSNVEPLALDDIEKAFLKINQSL
jgi:ATP-dependent Clp protease ATP-binding subunit ClpA